MDASNRIPTLERELQLRAEGYRSIAGVDEAGRGPLAGPVVAAAVILPEAIDPHILGGIRDSKQLSEPQRDQFYGLITRHAVAWSVSYATAREIETIDIRKASLLAMKRAVEHLRLPPDYVLVDGRDYPDLAIPGEAMKQGDARSITIGAASILAKVSRDRWMNGLHAKFPAYGFDSHKGYPTAFHRLAVNVIGPCEQHRATFAHVVDLQQHPGPRDPVRRALQHILGLNTEQQLNDYVHSLDERLFQPDEWDYLRQRVRLRRNALRQSARTRQPALVDIGSKQEDLAIRYLQHKGYCLWERNYRGREGEIDLVMNHGSIIVFVEVKFRSSDHFGQPYESVTAVKRRKIIRTADRYLYERGLLDGWDIRYDIVSIVRSKHHPPQIEHIEDAFRVDGELE